MRLIDSDSLTQIGYWGTSCLRFCSSTKVFVAIQGEGIREGFRAYSLGIWDQGLSSLLGISEQNRLRCLLVVRFFLLGNRRQGPSLKIGVGRGVK